MEVAVGATEVVGVTSDWHPASSDPPKTSKGAQCQPDCMPTIIRRSRAEIKQEYRWDRRRP